MKRTTDTTTVRPQDTKKKLELTRESIRPLTDDKLEDVVGGGITTGTSRPRACY
jgi:hypothetical protein